MLRVRIAELLMEQDLPPPIERIALALSIKLKSSRSLYLARNISAPFLPPKGSRLVIDSSIALKASSRFLNKQRVPMSLKLMRASFYVFLLVSIKAAKMSVRILLVYSLEAFVTRASDAYDSVENSALDVPCKQCNSQFSSSTYLDLLSIFILIRLLCFFCFFLVSITIDVALCSSL